MSPDRPSSRFLRGRGFTLIELMVTITLLAILLALAVPSFNTWINNTRVRTVAESLQNGVRLAQAEAVRRNRTVSFFLTNANPSAVAAATDDGSNWGLRTIALLTDDPGATADARFVRGGALSDVAAGVLIAGPAAVCFNAAGQQVTNADEGCAVAAVNYDVTRTGAERRLRIEVSIGGRVRMCDPDKTLSATDPDGCTA